MDTFQKMNLLASLPEFLVWGAGAVLCVCWSRRSPGVASLLGTAVLLQVVRRLMVIGFPAITPYLDAWVSVPEYRFLTLYLLLSIPNAVSWGLVLLAFWREAAARRVADSIP